MVTITWSTIPVSLRRMNTLASFLLNFFCSPANYKRYTTLHTITTFHIAVSNKLQSIKLDASVTYHLQCWHVDIIICKHNVNTVLGAQISWCRMLEDLWIFFLKITASYTYINIKEYLCFNMLIKLVKWYVDNIMIITWSDILEFGIEYHLYAFPEVFHLAHLCLPKMRTAMNISLFVISIPLWIFHYL